MVSMYKQSSSLYRFWIGISFQKVYTTKMWAISCVLNLLPKYIFNMIYRGKKSLTSPPHTKECRSRMTEKKILASVKKWTTKLLVNESLKKCWNDTELRENS